jgi:hypothetical protein
MDKFSQGPPTGLTVLSGTWSALATPVPCIAKRQRLFSNTE